VRTKQQTLFTFGYEGISVEQFLSRLEEVGVKAVFDVRQLPLSRKRGLSKNALSQELHERGIVYAHLPAFGCPKPIRDRYRTDGDWPRYVKSFSSYLAGQREPIAELAQLASKTIACLICFEADFTRCHRSLVARAVAHAGGPSAVHLTIKEEIPELRRRSAA
jgi:uncharacterized protein (DUF488 family)